MEALIGSGTSIAQLASFVIDSIADPIAIALLTPFLPDGKEPRSRGDDRRDHFWTDPHR
jgi:hypothetical protein